MPKGFPPGSLTLEAVAELVVRTIGDSGLSLDDGLWCYAYEPQCQKMRALCNKAAGAQNKAELIDWCDAHSDDEQRDLVRNVVFDPPPIREEGKR